MGVYAWPHPLIATRPQPRFSFHCVWATQLEHVLPAGHQHTSTHFPLISVMLLRWLACRGEFALRVSPTCRISWIECGHMGQVSPRWPMTMFRLVWFRFVSYSIVAVSFFSSGFSGVYKCFAPCIWVNLNSAEKAWGHPTPTGTCRFAFAASYVALIRGSRGKAFVGVLVNSAHIHVYILFSHFPGPLRAHFRFGSSKNLFDQQVSFVILRFVSLYQRGGKQ